MRHLCAFEDYIFASNLKGFSYYIDKEIETNFVWWSIHFGSYNLLKAVLLKRDYNLVHRKTNNNKKKNAYWLEFGVNGFY